MSDLTITEYGTGDTPTEALEAALDALRCHTPEATVTGFWGEVIDGTRFCDPVLRADGYRAEVQATIPNALEQLLCPACGHDLEDHGLADCCECSLSPTGVAYALIGQAVKEVAQ